MLNKTRALPPIVAFACIRIPRLRKAAPNYGRNHFDADVLVKRRLTLEGRQTCCPVAARGCIFKLSVFDATELQDQHSALDKGLRASLSEFQQSNDVNAIVAEVSLDKHVMPSRGILWWHRAGTSL